MTEFARTLGVLPEFLVRGEGAVESGRALQIAAPDAGGPVVVLAVWRQAGAGELDEVVAES